MYDNISKFIKNEFNDLDRRAAANGKLNMQEVQYADMLAHFKKNMLTGEAMENAEGGYNKGYERSYNEGYSDGYNDGMNKSENSYHEGSGYGARGRGKGARRDSMGRYADEAESGSYHHGKEMIDELHDLMNEAPNEQIKHRYKSFISEIQSMM